MMERDVSEEALLQLVELAAAQGYVTFDNIMDTGDSFDLSIGDFDWLTETLTAKNVIIYDSVPAPVSADDDYDDFAQIDYEKTFQEIENLAPSLIPLIEEIRGIMPPQRGEVAQLKYQVYEGNAHAHNRMVEMYLRLALRIALSRAKSYDMDIIDAVESAIAGLIIAVDKYDPDRSGPFVSYASMWIFQNITREQFTQNPYVYFPVHKKEQYYSVYPLLKNQGCIGCPELRECEKAKEIIQNKIRTDDDDLSDLYCMLESCESLDTIIERTEYHADLYQGKLQPFLLYDPEDDWLDAIERDSASERLWNAVSRLKPRSREIIIAKYGLDGTKEKTLEEVGQIHGLTRERIRQIEAKTLIQIGYYLTGRRIPQQKKADNKAKKLRGK